MPGICQLTAILIPLPSMPSSHMSESREGYDLAFLGESIKNVQQPMTTGAVGRGGTTEKAAAGPGMKDSHKPNIIAIMNESFSDLRAVGDFSDQY